MSYNTCMAPWKQTPKYFLACLMVLCLTPTVAWAAQTASPNYILNEVFFGSGGELNACSTSYCSKQSAGELATGTTASPNFRAHGGFNTNRTPYIQFTVSNTNIDLGTLAATTTQTANATFSVQAYLSHGYTVINASDPPSNNGYFMKAIGPAPAGSSVGTEQFGINLTANTAPVTFGALPQYVPDNTFSFGAVAPNYSAANTYKYLKNETIAFSNSSSSATTYTISYVFNISNVTPGGTYVLRHVLVATGTY